MSNAYIETTILADILLKPGSKKQAKAKAALARYDSTLLPVYSIKEWKAGILDRYAYFHDKLVETGSVSNTLDAINSLHPVYKYRLKTTSFEAFQAAAYLVESERSHLGPVAEQQSELADRFRLAVAKLIITSWRNRRRIAAETIQDLDCYTEAEPGIGKDGFFDLSPKECSRDRHCALWEQLRARRDLLTALRKAIPETSTRDEDRNRRKVLKQLINTPKIPLNREQCRALGDAVFAFFCPGNAVILTTNIKDHQPLAEAIGKRAETP